MTYLHVDFQTHLGLPCWKIWVLLREWATELLKYSFYRARLNMSWMAISMKRKNRQNPKSVKILLSKLPSPFLLPWSSHPGGELVFLSLQKHLGMCGARHEQSSSQHRQAGSTTELSRDRNEKWKVNILAPKSFWQTRDYLWTCQEELSRQTPEPSVSEVTSSFGKLCCDVPSLRKVSECSPCEKPFSGLGGGNSNATSSNSLHIES